MRLFVISSLVLALAGGAPAVGRAEPTCARVVSARVVALDQPYWLNRYGAYEPQGMIFALERDVVANGHDDRRCPARQEPLVPGQVRLRASKRPRPLVLRINAGDCLDLHFTNLLALTPVDGEQPATRAASIHVEVRTAACGSVPERATGSSSRVSRSTTGFTPPTRGRTYSPPAAPWWAARVMAARFPPGCSAP